MALNLKSRATRELKIDVDEATSPKPQQEEIDFVDYSKILTGEDAEQTGQTKPSPVTPPPTEVAPVQPAEPVPQPKPKPKPEVKDYTDVPTEQLTERLRELKAEFLGVQSSLANYRQQVLDYEKQSKFQIGKLKSDYDKSVKTASDAVVLGVYQQKAASAGQVVSDYITRNKPEIASAVPVILDFESHWAEAANIMHELSTKERKDKLNSNQKTICVEFKNASHIKGKTLLAVIKEASLFADNKQSRLLAELEQVQSSLGIAIANRQSRFQDDTMQEDLDSQLNQHRFEHQMSQEQQETVSAAVEVLFGGFGPSQKVALNRLSEVIITCIREEVGGLSVVSQFGVGADYSIIVNGAPVDIKSSLQLDNSKLSHFCKRDAQAIAQGHYASCIDYADLYVFPNLSELDFEAAPVNVIADAARDLGIDKGRWGNLFKRRAKMPCLQVIRLPEGVMTRENASVWGKFKSNAEYLNLVNTARNKEGVFAEGGGTPDLQAEARVAPKYNVLPTLKSLVWNKPLPKLLLKTFGYGAGVPLYWGIMSALGPFGMVMGALGIGAMAKHEFDVLKNKT